MKVELSPVNAFLSRRASCSTLTPPARCHIGHLRNSQQISDHSVFNWLNLSFLFLVTALSPAFSAKVLWLT